MSCSIRGRSSPRLANQPRLKSAERLIVGPSAPPDDPPAIERRALAADDAQPGHELVMPTRPATSAPIRSASGATPWMIPELRRVSHG